MVLEKTRVSWTVKRSNQSILKEISPEYSFQKTDAEAETPCFWKADVKKWLTGKDPDAGKDWRQEKGITEDEMVGWHHLIGGNEFWAFPGIGSGQGSLACCSPWGHKELDMTEWLNWIELKNEKVYVILVAANYMLTYYKNYKHYLL